MRIAVVLLSLLVACGKPAETAPVETPKPLEAPPKAEAPKPAPPATIEAMTVPAGANPALLDPSLATETAPAEFKARFETTKGSFVVDVHRDWAPNGADRFYNLVKIGFFDNTEFFRVVDGFMVQFGISAYPDVNTKWREARIKDDPNKQKNSRGRFTFATSGPDSRTTQVFINFGDNTFLDPQGFSPIGEITEGMDVVDMLYKGYGEGAPQGRGPNQMRIQKEGNAYLQAEFPSLDSVKTAKIE